MRSETTKSDLVFNSSMNEYQSSTVPVDQETYEFILDDNSYNTDMKSNSKCSSRMGSILEEFTKLYTEKLDRIANQGGGGGGGEMKRKVSVLECWVNDLGEQNNILVSTVEELEREANRRVSLLQEELDKMAVVTKQSCVSLRDHQVQVNCLMKQKVSAEEDLISLQEKILDLENTNASLLRENSDLHQDLDNVLEVMSRGRMTGRWVCDDFVFNSLKPEQIMGSNQPSSVRKFLSPTHNNHDSFEEKPHSEISEICKDSLTSSLSLDVEESAMVPKLRSEVQNLKKIQLETHAILNQRDSHIADLQSQLTNLHQKLTAAQTQVDNTTLRLQNLMDRGRHDSLEIYRRDDMIRQLLSPTHHIKGETVNSTEKADFKSKLDVELELSENIDIMALRLADLEEECKKLRRQNDTVKSSQPFCNPSTGQLVEELANVNATNSMFSAQKKWNNDSQSETGFISKQIETEKEALSDNVECSDSKAKKKLISNSHKIAKLENELSEKSVLIRELQNHLVVSTEELRLKDETLYNIEQKLDSIRRKYNEKEERMLYLMSQLTNLQLEISRLHGSAQQLRLQLDNKSELVLKLERENRSLVRQLNEKSFVHERTEKDFSKLMKDIDWKKETTEQKAKVGTLQEVLSATGSTCDKLRTQYDSESGSNLAFNQSHPALLHRDRMDSLSLKPGSSKDSASHLPTVLPDLRSLNTNTSPLSRNCPDVVSFLSRENSFSGDTNFESKDILNFCVPQNCEDIPLSYDRKSSETKSLTLSLPGCLKSLDKTFQNESKSMTVLSPSDSGIGSEDFGTIPGKSYKKINGKRRGTFGKIFEI